MVKAITAHEGKRQEEGTSEHIRTPWEFKTNENIRPYLRQLYHTLLAQAFLKCLKKNIG